ncbi:MAG: signal peptidase I, partial [Prevotellaceae bacterium]|nr:signal peptidase I [Prevotellaceae bacterium]
MSSNKEQASFSERLQKPVKQWIKSIFWCVVYILFVAWVGNYWWLLLLPFVFDAFITHFIPWSWWRNTKNRTVRAVMGWVDAIVFALIAVYFINLFLFQNYQIPTSSLEKSLMVGDFLLVSKASYGPRIPNTPLSLPLVQNTLPVFNSKSYFEKPQWEYRRLQGFDNIDRNDIVVFNFPTGDSVPLKVNVPDYYTICYEKGRELLGYDESIKAETCQAFGRSYVKRHPEEYGKVIWRPIDKRENYVKRCVGVPGDKLQIIDNQVYVNGKTQEKFAGIQFNYFVQTDGTPISEKLKDELGISNDDFIYFQSVNQTFAEAHGLIPNAPCYHFPLTQAMYEKLASLSFITKIVITKPTDFKPFDDVFP